MNTEDVQKELDKKQREPKVIFSITKSFRPEAKDEGVDLAENFIYDVNGNLPEIALAIAVFAGEMPKNKMGENSDVFFVQLINDYFNKLKSQNNESE